ncbi:MAG: hypothetical protein D6694_09225 [Gammaproteobacteria bacterium]|nr:MAG: hypothetical protein D6694_09225 [Gammaproteobacteria bacterium]
MTPKTLNPNELACQEAIALLDRPKPRYRLQVCEDLGQLQQLWKIDREAYKDCSLSFDRFREWWTRYEFGSRILLEGDCILAALGIYPISPEQYHAFSDGQIPENKLVPVPFEECEANPQSCWYASGIVTAEQVRGWGSPLKLLLQAGIGCWADSRHIAFPLKLMAIAEYEAGARLLNFLGFEQTRDGGSMPDGCDLYETRFNSESDLRSQLRKRGL